jgi:hypothetical protein
MYSADRMTHLKIVIVALVAGTMVAGIGVAARIAGTDANGNPQVEAKAPVIKAGQPKAFSSSGNQTVR